MNNIKHKDRKNKAIHRLISDYQQDIILNQSYMTRWEKYDENKLMNSRKRKLFFKKSVLIKIYFSIKNRTIKLIK